MHHELLKSCLPLLIALAVLFAIAQLVVRLSGARLHLRRLSDVHRCEAGGVQSLAFVLTLPIFLMVVLFIVQIALVMIGMITVNTAAFAAARSASVWIPAWTDSVERENVLTPGSILPDKQISFDVASDHQSEKYRNIFDAAVLACVPIAPSNHRFVSPTDPMLSTTHADTGLTQLYGQLVPQSASDPVITRRLQRKIAYCLKHTRVVIHFVDKNSGHGPDSAMGPTYNPFEHPEHIPWRFYEVGWQDPVTITVEHDFALLPGPGQFLARMLTRYDGRTDDVAPTIRTQENFHTTEIRGSATLTIEGLKSIRPYVQQY